MFIALVYKGKVYNEVNWYAQDRRNLSVVQDDDVVLSTYDTKKFKLKSFYLGKKKHLDKSL